MMKKAIRPKSPKRAKAIGMNHIALEVGDVPAALEFYGRLFDLKLCEGQSGEKAIIDLGDQFIVLRRGVPRRPDGRRHFGLVVDDSDAIKRELDRVGKEVRRINDYEFLDPWGNRVQIIEYGECLFSKTPEVLRNMKLEKLEKAAGDLETMKKRGVL